MGYTRKEIERRALEAAQCASAIIPGGLIHDFDQPDFILETDSGAVGIEVTELLTEAGSDSFSNALEEKSFQEEVVRVAEQQYSRTPGAMPAEVFVNFWNVEARKYDKRAMAQSLVDFVKLHRAQAVPTVEFSVRSELPEGFDLINITATNGPWLAGEGGKITLVQIFERLAGRIHAKNERISTYRFNLPNVPLWLLVYSGTEVSRGVPMPHGIGGRAFPSEFDRVFFFSALSKEVAAIRKA
jgi:hypothetical protein